MSNKEDMYHTCRYCKYYDNGKCINDTVAVAVCVQGFELEYDDVEIFINDPETFYCKEWE